MLQGPSPKDRAVHATEKAQWDEARQAAWKASTARLGATLLGRQVGDHTTLDLLQAQNDAAQSELGRLRAQSELLQTRLQLNALTGSLSVHSLQGLNAQLAPQKPIV